MSHTDTSASVEGACLVSEVHYANQSLLGQVSLTHILSLFRPLRNAIDWNKSELQQHFAAANWRHESVCMTLSPQSWQAILLSGLASNQLS